MPKYVTVLPHLQAVLLLFLTGHPLPTPGNNHTFHISDVKLFSPNNSHPSSDYCII